MKTLVQYISEALKVSSKSKVSNSNEKTVVLKFEHGGINAEEFMEALYNAYEYSNSESVLIISERPGSLSSETPGYYQYRKISEDGEIIIKYMSDNVFINEYVFNKMYDDLENVYDSPWLSTTKVYFVGDGKISLRKHLIITAVPDKYIKITIE